MKEAEFRALLAIEGLELHIEQQYFRWNYDWRSSKLHSLAVIKDKEGNRVMYTNWVQRRYYAIQNLIKRYYGDRR